MEEKLDASTTSLYIIKIISVLASFRLSPAASVRDLDALKVCSPAANRSGRHLMQSHCVTPVRPSPALALSRPAPSSATASLSATLLPETFAKTYPFPPN